MMSTAFAANFLVKKQHNKWEQNISHLEQCVQLQGRCPLCEMILTSSLWSKSLYIRLMLKPGSEMSGGNQFIDCQWLAALFLILIERKRSCLTQLTWRRSTNKLFLRHERNEFSNAKRDFCAYHVERYAFDFTTNQHRDLIMVKNPCAAKRQKMDALELNQVGIN